MKKNTNNNRAAKRYQDEKFAKKILSQTIISLIVFALIFINSKLPYAFNKEVNKTIKHYLTVSVDFNKVVSATRVYIDNFFNQVQTLPASNADENGSAGES